MRNLGILIFNWVNKHPVRSFFIYFGLILLLPLVFTIKTDINRINFTNTGQIGDTIGGITAPFIGLISAYLIYISFKQQFLANQMIIESRQEDAVVQNINLLVNRIEKAINDFSYGTLTNSKAIFHFCSRVRQENENENYGIHQLQRFDWENLSRYYQSIEMKSILQTVKYFDYILAYVATQKVDSSLMKFNLDYLKMLYKDNISDNIKIMDMEHDKIKQHNEFQGTLYNWVKLTCAQVEFRFKQLENELS